MTDLYSCIAQQEMPRMHPQGSVCLSKLKPILQKAQNYHFFKQHFIALGVSQDVVDAHRLHPCALSASTRQYLDTYDRQAESMFAFLMKYRGILRLEWDNLKSNSANVCRRHNRHHFITEWVFRHVATRRLGSGWGEWGRGSDVSPELVIH